MRANRILAACCLLVSALVSARPASARSPGRPERFSITLQAPYDRVLDVVREVCSDGVIHGAEQYESDQGIDGATAVGSSHAFPQWTGSGQALYKVRPRTIAPSHFEGSRDIGTLSLRYLVEPDGNTQTRLTIEAVFLEDNHHGRHPSQGTVEVAEFGEVAKRLKPAARQEPSRKVEAIAAAHH